ncbi:MAG: hypothetical protein SNJ71_03180, partial [Bacteroidales bacterium]
MKKNATVYILLFFNLCGLAQSKSTINDTLYEGVSVFTYFSEHYPDSCVKKPKCSLNHYFKNMGALVPPTMLYKPKSNCGDKDTATWLVYNYPQNSLDTIQFIFYIRKYEFQENIPINVYYIDNQECMNGNTVNML